MDRQKIKIASPCSQNFDEMEGEGHKRFCDSCDKHVHNLSDLTRDEAMELIKANANGGMCVVYTFDTSNRVRFRDDLGARRPPKRQLHGLKRLLAAAAMVPVLATLPACDPAPAQEQVIFEGYQAYEPCDLPAKNTFKPIDAIIEAEQKFVEHLKELLGFVPEEPVQMMGVMIAEEPDFIPVEPEPPILEEMGEAVYVPEVTPEPPEPVVVPEPAVVPEPQQEPRRMGRMRYIPEVEEPEPVPKPEPAVIERKMMGDMMFIE